ncbi:MAG: hypothetical protein UX02_C0001G0293 [Candidatus Moranbacteria bacterium GW2011_GWC1_45_18]|nr:MAG: hypothetical protein UT79_C0002G0104 [Candidatus Moranbacteria bacterium GW2011_GWC2_40_12]KKT32495.1 MAG: hypothetical protein UW19_C0020G0012 [Candidatus Moranbacteria bacterium GW2011_GWF2_44_10]KKU00845.1 MAG: hypothetical protein UX02_C0001G0293 [Candidatus Moranbacteria bacterium GW2011_GWC1_45_18]OGI24119.1 MAG: hypothetical protein A2194_02285 [Candidatus Moranbacteria bacterium RIFOXYA1_FULL_44_8]OGI35662.1 MAG: hypothetical protein A2407_02025 [Candidatus Moranbacteria bacteri
MEDFKKKFVLLSAIAKEKKYAQEYLGLLARRGDIGSIRIGKRWYTKVEWFSEFLSDAEARKAEAKNLDSSVVSDTEKINQKEKIVAKGTSPLEKIAEHQIRIAKPLEKNQEEVGVKALPSAVSARKEPMQKKNEVLSVKREETKNILLGIANPRPVLQKSFAAERKMETINLKINRNAKPAFSRKTPNISKIKKYSLERKNQPLPIEKSVNNPNWAIRTEDPSPNFVPVESRMGFFPKFAFSMSVVLILVLLVQFGWIFKNELKGMIGIESGIVAGAQDSKANLDVVRNSSASYLGNQGDRVRENISISRVLIRAAIERSSEQEPANNGQ